MVLNRDDILKVSKTSLKVSKIQSGTFTDFLLNHVHHDRGPYTFEKHEVFRYIAENLAGWDEVWVLKGAQIGISTMFLGYYMWLLMGKGYNIGYGLPTKVFAKRFIKTRFKVAVRKDRTLDSQIKVTTSDGLMEVSNNFLYMLGMEDISDAISIPLDAIGYDEVDVLNVVNMAWSQDRVAASDFQQFCYFSVGMNPGHGIDAGFQDSDQRVWLVRCPACRYEFNLEDSWPKEGNPEFVLFDGSKFVYICPKCSRPFDVERDGRFVAKYPDRDVVGLRIPQLIVPQIQLGKIMQRWDRAQKRKSLLAKFNCSTLAKPDAGDRQRITAENLSKAADNYPLVTSATWSVGGADVGDYCHLTFTDVYNEKLRFISIKKCFSDNMVDEIAKLIEALNCRCFVIDAKPFRTEVRKLYRMFPNIVVLQYFKDTGFAEGTEEHEEIEYRTVQEDRDDSLDEYTDLYTMDPPGIIIPKVIDGVDVVESEFGKHHIKGSQKEEVLDPKSGKTITRYRKGVENHYLMAGNNARKAFRLLQMDFQKFVGVPPIFGDLR